MSVDLPEPFGPTSPKISPSPTWPDTPSRAWTPPKCLTRFSNRRSATDHLLDRLGGGCSPFGPPTPSGHRDHRREDGTEEGVRQMGDGGVERPQDETRRHADGRSYGSHERTLAHPEIETLLDRHDHQDQECADDDVTHRLQPCSVQPVAHRVDHEGSEHGAHPVAGAAEDAHEDHHQRNPDVEDLLDGHIAHLQGMDGARQAGEEGGEAECDHLEPE